jgi:N-sulfoglucosamine sulfohydrolase
MTRRSFAAASLAAGVRGAAARPNIVLVLADDLTWNECEPYGSTSTRTPHLARFAREALCFDRMFTATAMCAPTRQQLYTGIYPVRNGAYPNHSRIRDGIRTLPDYFRELGYRVGLTGKEHFGPPEAYPFERIGTRGADPDPRDLSAVSEFLQRDGAQPFCLVFASHQPHVPWNTGDPASYPPEKQPVPPYLPDTPETRFFLSRYRAEVTYFDTQVGALLKAIDDAGARDSTIVVVTSEQGSQLPFCKWTCYENGLKTAFLVRWPGRVKPGTRTAAMAEYVDVLPTLMEAAGQPPPRDFDGRSFLPVLLGRAGAHKAHVFGVHTTRGIIQGSDCYPVRSVRSERYKYIRNLQPDPPFRNIITEQKDGLIRSWLARGGEAAARARMYLERPAEELYDLRSDPNELNNLASEPALRPLLAGLRRRLEDWMQRQGDEGVATEMRARERQMSGSE